MVAVTPTSASQQRCFDLVEQVVVEFRIAREQSAETAGEAAAAQPVAPALGTRARRARVGRLRPRAKAASPPRQAAEPRVDGSIAGGAGAAVTTGSWAEGVAEAAGAAGNAAASSSTL